MYYQAPNASADNLLMDSSRLTGLAQGLGGFSLYERLHIIPSQSRDDNGMPAQRA